MKKKTAPPLIAHVIYRLGVGGLENGLINLINQMPDDQYHHLIICLTESTSFSERLTCSSVKIITLNKRPGQDWHSFLNFYRIMKQYRVDIVHTRNLGTIEYQLPAWLAGVKFRVHGEHGWDVFDPFGENKKYQWLRRLLSPFIDTFIPLSSHLEQYLCDKVGVPEHKICRICNGVDTRKFYPAEHNIKQLDQYPFELSTNMIYIGTVGRMQGVKDQLNLVKAFIYLLQKEPVLKGQIFLWLVGEGELRQQSVDLLKKNYLYEFAWLPGERQDIADIMRCLDIFVLPSKAEGISNTILEAMATKLPVVATKVGGNTELVVHDKTGLLVPAENPQAMAKALSRLVNHSEHRHLQGQQGYQRVHELFSIQAMVERYTAVYDRLRERKN